jgi:hypothetical protein
MKRELDEIDALVQSLVESKPKKEVVLNYGAEVISEAKKEE